jgi:predicted dehydrogenase
MGTGARAAGPYVPPTEVDVGKVSSGKVVFPEWGGPADKPTPPPPAPLPPDQRVGFAVVGLGKLSLGEILPAFAQSKKARLAALVSGSPEKLRTVAQQYGVKPESCLDYAAFDRIKDDPAIQAVYIVLPNAMHREYVERAAAAGKHVLCEKPMATSVEDARAMVAACARANVRLMIAYRCQYEPHHLRVQAYARQHTFGRSIAMSAHNVQQAAPDAALQWRHKKAMAGGGSLVDIGLYCLNAARFVTGEEPVEVFATTFSPPGDPRYAEVEETISFSLRFPSGFTANAVASYGAREHRAQALLFEQATLDMSHAYDYEGQRLMLGRREGNESGEDTIELPHKNQFAAELDHLATCILEKRRPRTPGEEGVQDHVIMEALYRSAATRRPVGLPAASGLDATRGPMPEPS